ncbi:NADP-dependent oxidoreductase [Propionibacteriaceae bacterium G1746]|uniref:NADP-dependent oxidoreductase n=1 Tax=Aestuariimicrobium sp. G57 TaxID=3418485 RepID=UPI003C1F9654
MLAIEYTEHGGPEVLHLSDAAAEPTVGPGEVRIAVKASSVNPVDWKIVKGRPDMPVAFPAIPGRDAAGVVESVGEGVTGWSIGDEVVTYGHEGRGVRSGGYAELMTVPADALGPKPRSLTWDEAGALPCAGLTAYQVLRLAGVGEGDTVMVHAAAGGVGHLAVQIARALGAGRVIGTASAPNHEFLRGLRAEPVTYGDGLVDQVRALAPQGVDVVVDLVGGGVADQTMAVLAPEGRHASITDRQIVERGGHYLQVAANRADFEALGELFDAGSVKMVLAAVFDLADAAQAFRLSQTRHGRGKIAIHVSA